MIASSKKRSTQKQGEQRDDQEEIMKIFTEVNQGVYRREANVLLSLISR